MVGWLSGLRKDGRIDRHDETNSHFVCNFASASETKQNNNSGEDGCVSKYQMTDLGKPDLVYTSVTFCSLAYWQRDAVLGLPSFLERRK